MADAVEILLDLMDALDADSDFEPDNDAEPSLSAPEHHMSQLVWGRGGDDDREEADDTTEEGLDALEGGIEDGCLTSI